MVIDKIHNEVNLCIFQVHEEHEITRRTTCQNFILEARTFVHQKTKFFHPDFPLLRVLKF